MFELTLSDLADIAEVVSATSILGGIIFGLIQIRAMHEQKRDNIAINLSQTFHNKDFADALIALQEVPNGSSLAEIRHMGPEYAHAALTAAISLETMGLLVYRRIAPFDLVMDLAGGTVTTTRRRLGQWLIDSREELNQPSYAEWFEWLGDQAKREKTNKPPAQIAYRNWRP